MLFGIEMWENDRFEKVISKKKSSRIKEGGRNFLL